MMNEDYLKLVHDKRISDVFSQIIAKEIEYYKAVILMGQSAIKSSLFINAGALVTTMAFFNANVKSIEDGIQEYVALSGMLIFAMAIWLTNILLCIISYGFAYLSEQRNYVNHIKHSEELRHAVIEIKNYAMPIDEKSILFGRTACGCIITTYISFFYSIYICYKGFSCFVASF